MSNVRRFLPFGEAMRKLLWAVTLGTLPLTACTTVNVRKVDATAHPIKLVCIEENPKVLVSDLLVVLDDGFQRHGIKTLVYKDKIPDRCEYTLWYTATRGWDFTPFLNYVELRLRRGDESVAAATYKHGGGLALNKWASTEEKLTPVINELLAGFSSKATK
jgi:hypothetical protein